MSWIDPYLSANRAKRNGEVFFLWWHVAWLAFYGYIVVSGVYETFDAWSYTKVGIPLTVLPIVLPLLFPALSGESGIPWYDRYTTKANIFIAIFSFVGNHFWTHYFYKVLNTDYTFPSHRFNNVPIACTMITHSYFHQYHGFAAIGLRALYRKISTYSKPAQYAIVTLTMLVAGYVTAVVEVATISSFPYYTYEDAWAMWVIGSGFYGLYFLTSFPMFHRIDEDVDQYDKNKVLVQAAKRWTCSDVVKDILAHCMFTTILLDLWRLLIGDLSGLQSLEVPWIFSMKKI